MDLKLCIPKIFHAICPNLLPTCCFYGFLKVDYFKLVSKDTLVIRYGLACPRLLYGPEKIVSPENSWVDQSQTCLNSGFISANLGNIVRQMKSTRIMQINTSPIND